MKKHLAIIGIVVLALGFCSSLTFAQAAGTVKGVCKDAEGKPIVGGIFENDNLDNGQKYNLKTNNKGEYFSLGITPGKYKVVLYKTPDDQKAGKELFHQSGFPVQLDENTLDFDLQKEAERQAKGEGLSPEEAKARQEAAAKAQKETTTVKTLQGKLDAANAAIQAKDYETAITNLTEANQVDPTRDVLGTAWGTLTDYQPVLRRIPRKSKNVTSRLSSLTTRRSSFCRMVFKTAKKKTLLRRIKSFLVFTPILRTLTPAITRSTTL